MFDFNTWMSPTISIAFKYYRFLIHWSTIIASGFYWNIPKKNWLLLLEYYPQNTFKIYQSIKKVYSQPNWSKGNTVRWTAHHTIGVRKFP